MKRKKISLLTILIGLIIVAGSSFRNSPNPNQEMKQVYLHYLQDLQQDLSEFPSNPVSLQSDYLDIRRKFKFIEFLLAHMDQEYYLKKINGAPLPKPEKKAPDMHIVQPSGFQVLDELIYTENSTDEIELIRQKALDLKKAIEQSMEWHGKLRFTDQLVLQAAQYQLLRIYTTGITGFDTPGSLNGISDAINSLKGIRLLLEKSGIQFAETIKIRLNTCIQYLENNLNFNRFNRAVFYRDHWTYLYRDWVRFRRENHLQTVEKGMSLNLDEESEELFSESIFNFEAFINFPENKYTEEIIDLGEQLFYNKKLSADQSMSCATCHQPEKGFSDGLATSVEAKEEAIQRNSPGLWNAIYTKAYFHDLRASSLSQQFEHVIFNKDEFNTTLTQLLKTLQKDEKIFARFSKCFPEHGAQPINVYTFKTALSVYLSSLKGFDSPFDQYMRRESGTIDQQVIDGYNLFMGKASCATCHFPPNFSGLVPPYFNDSESEVLGVPADSNYNSIDPDPGRFANKIARERDSIYYRSVKTPSVRNVSKTAPYMHNGVFDNLDQVMEFYNNGGGLGHGFKLNNQTLAGDSLKLNEQEIRSIIRFMEALEEEG